MSIENIFQKEERYEVIYPYFCFMIQEPDLDEAVTQHSSLLILLENHMSLALGNLKLGKLHNSEIAKV